MVSGKVTVKNPTGLHLRPAGTLCKQAMQFKSSITFHYGDEIELFCEGEDEEEALQFLVNSIRTGLGEEL